MKRILILASILVSTTVAVHAQAFINADNAGTAVFITIADPSITSSPVKIGQPATVAGFTDAGRGQVSISLYAALAGTPLATLESAGNLVATANNLLSQLQAAQGLVAFGSSLALPSRSGFDGSQPLEFVLYGVSATGAYRGWSAEATGIIPATDVNIPMQIFGTAPGKINSFVLSGNDSLAPTPFPEPSTFALTGAGAAALAFLRKKTVDRK